MRSNIEAPVVNLAPQNPRRAFSEVGYSASNVVRYVVVSVGQGLSELQPLKAVVVFITEKILNERSRVPCQPLLFLNPRLIIFSILDERV